MAKIISALSLTKTNRARFGDDLGIGTALGTFVVGIQNSTNVHIYIYIYLLIYTHTYMCVKHNRQNRHLVWGVGETLLNLTS